MQAGFRFSGSVEVVISNQVNGVLIEIYEGLDPRTVFKSESVPATDVPERRQTILALSKSQSRAVASAIMGAAAEL